MGDEQRGNGAKAQTPTARLRAIIAAGLVAAALSLGIGVATLGAVAATATVAAGGLGVAHGACQSVEAGLAADLGVSIAALQTTESAGVQESIAARQAAGALTPIGARHATDRAAAYANCRQVFGRLATTPVAADPR